MNNFNKKNVLLRSTVFKFLIKVIGNSINNSDILSS